ncbi:hypothetical protein [Psychrobacter lutiphocae]|uniref:hypothetical protein n=1 Tax=Psychrobacter lutiphocae TaxID=540500 RepID=UPI0003760740|nr:hypothetical protein [Psychrobacter lutiphocae]
MAKKQKIDRHSPENLTAITQMQSKLRLGWLLWLCYRGFGLPILLSLFLPTAPDVVGGVAWHLLWLIPALVVSPWMLMGRSAYALLISSMLTLVYLGASGVTLFARLYDSGISVLWVYLLDTALLLLTNVWLFKLLKRLPSMNG